MEKHTKWSIMIPATLAGRRLDQALAELILDLSRSQAGNLIKQGLCLVNGKPAQASLKLQGGEMVQLQIEEPVETVEPENIPLNVVYEDDAILAVNKPAGMTSHPARGTPCGTLLNALVFHTGPGVRPTLVHRLDRDTSGVILVAKSVVAHRLLKEQADSGALKRTYQALVWGKVESQAGTINAPIGPERGDKTRMTITSQGKEAVTHYRVEEIIETSGGLISRVQIQLETGRTHQIRVHFAHIGNILVGERVYRNGQSLTETDEILPGQALHSRSLVFIHPVTKQELEIIAPIPDIWHQIIGNA